MIDRMLNIIRLMYIKVKETKLNILNDTYQDTIIGGIQGFLPQGIQGLQGASVLDSSEHGLSLQFKGYSVFSKD